MISLPDVSIAAKFVIKTHYIMRVLEFHPETQTVDVIQDVYEFTNSPFGTFPIKNEFGNYVNAAVQEPDVLFGIPVKQLRWGQFEIQCCPAPGDTGYIEVFTNDIRDWIENGSNSIPWTDSHFMKECSVFVPFLPNKQNFADTYPEDNSQLVIKSTNASITITDKPATNTPGEEPTEAVVDITTTAHTINVNAEKGITVNGDINITGNITATGNVGVTGDMNIDGNITATGTITSDKSIEATEDVKGGGISLKTHTHAVTFALTAPSGGGPVTGTITIGEPQ